MYFSSYPERCHLNSGHPLFSRPLRDTQQDILLTGGIRWYADLQQVFKPTLDFPDESMEVDLYSHQ